MKYLYLILSIFFMCVSANAQISPVEELFEKYKDTDGFTVVNISGKMFGMFASFSETEEGKNVMSNTEYIKVLSGETKDVNFYDELKGKMRFSDYEELMTVQEPGEVTKMLVKYADASQTKIQEFLLISSSNEENTLISIKGNLNIKDLAGFSSTLGIEELEQLEN